MYVKIFAGILDSSISSNTLLRRFFMDLLLMADRDGHVTATRDAIAKRLGVDRSEVDWGLTELMKADPESGNPDNEGKRIEPLEGRGYGWKILNYAFYRGIKTADELKQANARRQAAFRARRNDSNALRNASNKSNPIAYAEAYAEAGSNSISKAEDQKQKHTRAERACLSALPESFSISDGVRAWALRKGFDQLQEHLEAFCDVARAKDYRYASWDSAFKKAIREDWAQLRVPRIPRGVPALGKTAQAMHILEGMKRGQSNTDSGKAATPALSGPGRAASGGDDCGDCEIVDGALVPLQRSTA